MATLFCTLNSLLRRERHRLAVLAVVLGLGSAVVVAHTAMTHDALGDALVVCLAVADTAMAAAGAAFAMGASMRKPRWVVPTATQPRPLVIPSPLSVRARAGPPVLQCFRL